MININITYLHGTIKTSKQIKIPQRWEEVTFETYLKIVNLKERVLSSLISTLTGIDDDLINQLSAKDVKLIAGAIEFAINGHDYLLQFSENVPASIRAIDIGMESYGQMENAKLAINKCEDGGEDIINAAPLIVKLYTDEDILTKPVTDVFGTAAFFLRKLKAF